MCVMTALYVSPQTNSNSRNLFFRYISCVHRYVPMLKLIQDLRRTRLHLHREWEEEEEGWEGSGLELPLEGLWGTSLVTAEEDSE